MAGAAPSPPTAAEVLAKKRPSPRIAQMKRTWYFLSRNSLALIGLVIILLFIAVAIGSFGYNLSSTQLNLYCGSYQGQGSTGGPSNLSGACINVCTYPQGTPPPAPNCYATDVLRPDIVGPTIDLAHFSLGPLPLGSLSTAGSSYFYSIFQGVVKGAPWSLGISGGIVGAGAAIGLLLGSVAGFKGGLVDEVIMRLTDIFLSIPGLLLILVLLAVLGSSFTDLTSRILVLMGAFIVTWWPFYTRIVRGQVLVTREQKYVEASRASGAGTGRLLRKHIIPNSLFPVFVQMSLDVGAIPLLLGAIVFLGFHVFPSLYFPEWGALSALSIQPVPDLLTNCFTEQSLGQACDFPWWQLLFPGLTIFLFAISVNFLSDGLRDALDPRLRR